MVRCVQCMRYVFIFCSLSHARFAREHRGPREESLIFHRIGRYRFDESTQRRKHAKTSNPIFCRGHEAYGESVSPRFSINIYLPQLPLYLCGLCVRHLFIWLRRRRAVVITDHSHINYRRIVMLAPLIIDTRKVSPDSKVCSLTPNKLWPLEFGYWCLVIDDLSHYLLRLH